ncbi:LRR receptor-like serine threonine-protein kinase [Seminavis robusta]|uniref:LRR receptor-like serine threonine-protein kinase n=1 Tax=Seminavis robusta TaxID=568900 RepID=A0A9N8EC47_9STRA|nr:LRR receptor-like serine threonine-protein kinase [Seminavis robusta]|eukprot:Sro787_g202370.1 LRR receptor-like serine threonine-protein kinase (734) ;mRNA; r:27149-29668
MKKKTRRTRRQEPMMAGVYNNKPATPTMYVFSDIGEDKGEQEKKEMDLVIGRQHPTTFPNSSQPSHSSPQALDDVISSIQPLPTSTLPSLHRARRVREDGPGAYAVAGIRPIFHRPRSRRLTGRIPDMEARGLELVPTSQSDRDHNNGLIHADISNLLAFNFTRHNSEESTSNDAGLIHADPVDDLENGEIPMAEPITTRAKRLWKRKLFLFLSLETMVALVLVLIILVAFLLARKSSNQAQSAKQQNGVIPIQEYPGTTASITQSPISLPVWERLNLPDYTIRAMENPRSPQTKAYQWLSSNINKSNNTQHLPLWRLKQRFALATLYYSTRGDYWVKHQGWLDWDSNECNWEQLRWSDSQDREVACNDNGQLLSLEFAYANNLDGKMPPEISLLCDSLESLLLSWNLQLKGNIPTEVGLMTRLTALGFSATHLSGTLPTELGRLRSLENLIIAHSKLDGTLPTELGNLSNLKVLVSAQANISGSIPTEILRMSNLKTLSFSEFPLLDTEFFLHQVVGNLHNLELLSLAGRKIGGFTSIPSEIGRLTNLRSIGITDFQLNGTIPSEMGLLTKLAYLTLQRNSISGALPEELSKMSELRLLNIQTNQLEGRPLEQGGLHQLTKLQQLHINDNLFSGSLPTEVGLLSSLEILELQSTKISGTLPTQLFLLDNLTSLVVMNTSLTGSISDGLCGVLLSPHEMNYFGGNVYAVPTSNLSVCYGTSLCGCTCENCSKA